MKKNPQFQVNLLTAPAWLYQMRANSAVQWEPKQYRKEVRENETNRWPTGNIYFREQGSVSAGDTVVLFFCKTDCQEPGIYGWGTILVPPYRSGDYFSFVTKRPSDDLKKCPCWDVQVEALLDEIRGGQWVGTMWNISPNQLQRLRSMMGRHIGRH